MMMLSQDIFTNSFGGGAGRQYAGGTGMGMNFWISSGSYGPGDNNGGGLVKGGRFNTFLPSLVAQGNVVSTSPEPWNTGLNAFVEFAVIMEPFEETINFNPSKLIGVNLPCVPCCPLEPCMRHY
jgi:hypothetical protein